MIYCHFAIAMLLAAPLVVMAMQTLTPQPLMVIPAATPGPATVAESGTFGRPMSSAWAGPTPAAPMTGGMAPVFSSQSAPPGSPKAE